MGMLFQGWSHVAKAGLEFLLLPSFETVGPSHHAGFSNAVGYEANACVTPS